MNPQSSTDSSISSPSGEDAISRRAYELWEKEGRPEGSDLRHWLQAEQELGASRSGASLGNEADTPAATAAPRNTGTDTRPLQGTRAAAAANRDNKRGSASPFPGQKNGGNGSAARRKPGNSPLM